MTKEQSSVNKTEIYEQIALTSMLFNTEATDNGLSPTMLHIGTWFLHKKLSKFKTLSDLTVPISMLSKLIRENGLVNLINFDDAPEEITRVSMLMTDALENETLGKSLVIYHNFLSDKGYTTKKIESYIDVFFNELNSFIDYIKNKYKTNVEIDLIKEYDSFVESSNHC